MAHSGTDGLYFSEVVASFSKPSSTNKIFALIAKDDPVRFYSLRHTYICLRLMEGADIYQIAKNCRTSVEMIEKYYAAHIETSLAAAAINVMRPKKNKKGKKAILPTQASPQPLAGNGCVKSGNVPRAS